MSDYLRRLRHKVGHELLLLPAVTVLVVDEEKRVLLARHHNFGHWVAPGGMIEPSETPEQAVFREAKEEIGCEVTIKQLLGVFGGPEFVVNYENGDQVNYVMAVYQVDLVAGTLKPDGEEILELRYFTYQETKQLLTGRWLPVVLQHVFNPLN